jgi:hypothetical protein
MQEALQYYSIQLSYAVSSLRKGIMKTPPPIRFEVLPTAGPRHSVRFDMIYAIGEELPLGTRPYNPAIAVNEGANQVFGPYSISGRRVTKYAEGTYPLSVDVMF